MDAATFRARFPEFGDATLYPEPQVAFWLSLAASMLNAQRFADLLDFATALFVAHNLLLSRRNAKTGGAVTGPVASKAVDKVSVAYDTSAVTLENAGHWNATSYGVQLWQLMQLAGAGGVQII